MAERFRRVSLLPQNLYQPESPVLISAGALLFDTQGKKSLTQLKFYNLSKKRIRNLEVAVRAYNQDGLELPGIASFVYENIDIPNRAEFGQKTPIYLPSTETSRFDVIVKKIVFDDETVWQSNNQTWKPLRETQSVGDYFDADHAQQFEIELGWKPQIVPCVMDGFRYCACGARNLEEDTHCCVCGRDFEAQFDALNLERIEKNLAARKALEAEQVKEASYQEAILLSKSNDLIKTQNALQILESILDYHDAKSVYEECQEKIKELKTESDRSNKKKKIIATIAAIIALLFAVLYFVIIKPSVENKKILEFQNELLETMEKVDFGESVFFGEYEQDNNTGNGKEPIEWILLQRFDSSDQYLLASKYALDYQKYHDVKTDKKVLWEDCYLRQWLNEEFLNVAFSNHEQKVMAYTTATEIGVKNDKVSILGLGDLWYLIDYDYISDTPTKYANSRAKNTNAVFEFTALNGGYLAWTGSGGYIEDPAEYTQTKNGAIVPVIMIDLSEVKSSN